jgi:predicted Zn-dependent protease
LKKRGNSPAAFIELRNTIAKDPADIGARLLAAQLNIDMDAGDAALGILKRASEDGANDLDLLKLRVRASLLAHKYDDVLSATVDLSDQLSAADKAGMLADRGSALVALKNLEEARRTLADARALSPKSPDVLASLVRLEFAVGDLSTARRLLAEALAEAPDSLLLRQLEGDVSLHVQDYAQAEDVFRSVVNKAPWNGGARASLAMAQIGASKLKEAIATLDAAPDEDIDSSVDKPLPRFPILLYVWALASYRANDLEDAQKNAEQVVFAVPNFPQARLIAGLASYRLKKYERARYYLAFYVNEVPGDDEGEKFSHQLRSC